MGSIVHFRVPSPPSLPPDRRGCLKNNNRPGDFLAASRCAARTRCGGTCRQPAMANGRCRMHGGLSTGPRPAGGLANSRRARWKHGARSAEIGALRREARLHLRRVRTILTAVGSSAGHGVHRPKTRAVAGGFKPALDRPGSKLPGGARPGFSAGHGVDRSFSQATTASVPTRAGLKPAPTRKCAVARSGVFAPLRLCGSALVSAWHGVHRRFFARRAVVRSPAATNR
jgi:hypothetical protein